MTNSTIRRTLGASATLVVAGTLCLTTGGPAAHAAAHSQAAATKKFTFVTGGTELNGKTSPQVGLFHGAINGGGKDTPLAQSDIAHLSGGNITVKHPDSQSTFTPKIDASTCYVTFRITGKFSLTNGTGKYRGIAGHGTYSGHGYGYVPRKKDGTCNTNTEPQSEVFEIVGNGTLS